MTWSQFHCHICELLALSSMTTSSIRSIALCILRRGQDILVQEGYDANLEKTFYRPPGGGIEFGEYSWDAVRREMKEELSVEINNLAFMGTLESIFQYEGSPGHEMVFLFEAETNDAMLMQLDSVVGVESDGTSFKAKWLPLSAFRKGRETLYPDGLLDMLSSPALVGIGR